MEFVFVFAMLCLFIYGYALNIYKLFANDFEGPFKIVRVIGFFVPLVGVIAGFIN